MIEVEKVNYDLDVSLDQFFSQMESSHFLFKQGGELSYNQLYKQKFHTNVRRKFQLWYKPPSNSIQIVNNLETIIFFSFYSYK